MRNLILNNLTDKSRANFFSRVKKTKTCWFWVGRKNEYGYGSLELRTTPFLAHRVSWAIHNEREPKKYVLHKCDRPECVNPKHLYEGTQYDNMRDRTSRGRNPNLNKTHCPYGHRYSKLNTIYEYGSRHCRVCRNKKCRKYYWNNREKILNQKKGYYLGKRDQMK